jgi:hypothetical protein
MRIEDLSKNPSNNPTRTVDSVAAGSPAEEMGLRPDDEILEVNGSAVTADQVPELMLKYGTSTITLTVQRGEEKVRLGPVTPRIEAGVRHLGFSLRGGGDKPVLLRLSSPPERLTDRLRRFLRGGGTVEGVRG